MNTLKAEEGSGPAGVTQWIQGGLQPGRAETFLSPPVCSPWPHGGPGRKPQGVLEEEPGLKQKP